MDACVSAKSPLNSPCGEQRASERPPGADVELSEGSECQLDIEHGRRGRSLRNKWRVNGSGPGAQAPVLLFFCTMICGKFVLSLRHSSPRVSKWFCNHRSWWGFFCVFFSLSCKCPFCHQAGYQCATLKNKLKQPHVIYVGDAQRRLILCWKIKAEVAKRERITQLKILFLERSWQKIQEVIEKFFQD